MRIHHVALRTPDVGRLERFYGGLLGLRVMRRDEARGSVWLQAGDAIVMIEPAAAGEPSIPERTMELLAFSVEDKDAWRARIDAAGCTVEGETAYTVYFRDPDGRRVAVSTFESSPIG